MPGISMMPTYQEGQFIFVNRLAYRFSSVKRGDVVAITLKDGEAVLVKRAGVTLSAESEQLTARLQGVVFAQQYMMLDYDCPKTLLDSALVSSSTSSSVGSYPGSPSMLWVLLAVT